jgi:hypothetical protein
VGNAVGNETAVGWALPPRLQAVAKMTKPARITKIGNSFFILLLQFLTLSIGFFGHPVSPESNILVII